MPLKPVGQAGVDALRAASRWLTPAALIAAALLAGTDALAHGVSDDDKSFIQGNPDICA